MDKCAYRYARRRTAWKNNMQVFQTEGLPPSNGSAIFANIGWTTKSSAAAVNVVATNSPSVAL